MQASIEFLHQCQARDIPVVGSSSVPGDATRSLYPAWMALPMVTDPGFDGALQTLVRERGISRIFTPNMVVWHYLDVHLARIAPGVELLNRSPQGEALPGYLSAESRALERSTNPVCIAAKRALRPRIDRLRLAALYRHADAIPGMCDDDKIQAFSEVARHVPPGDWIEIGSWWGKSAFVLALLATFNQGGVLLCVDPWEAEHLVQQDAHPLLNQASGELDTEQAYRIFRINLLPFADGRVNVLRMPSVEAARVYGSSAQISSEPFGTTPLAGRVALLHIDGNHSREAVAADVAAWAGHVASGGWIVFDDYRWPYGDGPRVEGDRFLAGHAARVQCAFEMGGALFVQLA